MGFKFTFLCDLLSSLEDNRVVKAATEARKHNPDARTVANWFSRHGKKIRDPDTDQVALLSCMFPEKRTDCVYWLQDTGLARVIGRCLLLGSSRREELEKWRISGGADLGQCVENVMRQAENHLISGQEVTVEEIDVALTQIASRCRFSGPSVRRQRSAVDVEQTLSPLYRRLSSRDAKWLTRMILKTHFSHTIPEWLTMQGFHFLLPHLLLFQNSFEAALTLLSSEPIIHFPPRPEPGYAKDLGKIALHHIFPKIGIKIGRPEYYKARGIKHCCNMIGQKRMSVERKYDGEYCQIHVDLTKHPNSIQIFSKSGKDSTADRAGVHAAVRESLRIGKDGCKFKRRCVLEGELLVWSDRHHKIMPFHKIRKFVSRSGVLIGTESDSPPQPYERLIMVFFDILLLDDDVCLRKPHRERRLLLKNTIQVVSGIADIAEQHVIDFSHKDGQSKLEALFSSGIAQRWEGFVLKGCEDPYFPILTDSGAGCEGRWIKLKKDYILGLGDTVDLALVGAAYNARDATALGLVKKETWTHFFIGCLENKKDILRYNAEPRFQVIDVIDHHGMSQPNMKWLNTFAKYGARSADSCNEFDFENARPGMPQMDVVFKAPFVVEIMGAGFEKPSGARYYTLRFPRILKIHSDRSIEDTASFQELQLLAERAVSVPSDDMAEEEKEWAKRIKSSASMPGYLPDRSQSVSTTASSPVSVKTVPIHVDDRLTSSSSSDGCHEARGNVLASIGNVAIQRNTRKRKASPATSEIRYKGAYIGLGESRQTVEKVTASVLKDASSAISLVATRNDSNVDRVGISSQKSSGSTLNERVESATSPLTTFPIFIHSGTGFQSHPTVKSLTNISRNLDEFLAILIPKDHTPKLNLRKTIIGIIFTDDSKHPLESTILYLNEQISRVLAARSSTYPTKGRIFILDSKFSQVPIKWKHNRYCLRETWERISKTYFYACIAWDAEPCFGSRSKDCLDEIPSTTDDIDGDKGLDKTPKRHHGQAEGRIPKLRILFDRKEILVLGEFSSLDPLLRVGIPSG